VIGYHGTPMGDLAQVPSRLEGFDFSPYREDES
jgi:hypothetical protein